MSKPLLTLPDDKPKICQNCRFSRPHESNDGWRYCRAHSPDFQAVNGRAIWPTVLINEDCGEFKSA